MTKKEEIWVYIEHHLDTVSPVSLQLLSKARQIGTNFHIVAVICTQKTDRLAEQVAVYGPDEIILIQDDKINLADDVQVADVLQQCVAKRPVNSFLFGATDKGRSLAPRLQAKLQTGLTADCLDLYFDGNDLVQVKPSYADNVVSTIRCLKHRPQMASVRPNMFRAEKVDSVNPKITNMDGIVVSAKASIEVLAEERIANTTTDISQAERIIGVGRGVVDEQTIPVIDEVADLLQASVGITRPLTALAHYNNAQQIGQSGQVVAPKLLLNLGVHGAAQYVSGIRDAAVVVSVNTNKDAPIFAESDYAYVGDAKAFLHCLKQALAKK